MRTPTLLIVLLIAILTASPTRADTCANGRCPVPRWQAARPSVPSPTPQLRTATCRILHETGRGRSWGSGTLVRADNAGCVVLTCAHLFRDGAGRTRIWFSDGNALTVRLAGIDKQHDLAALVLDVEDVETNKRAVELATSPPQPGEVVYGCGYGNAGRFRCQAGAVVGFGHSRHGASASERPLTDTLLFGGGARQGDSGGGVFNRVGRLVAVVWGTDESRTMATTAVHIRRFLKSLVPRPHSRPRRQPRPQPRPMDAVPSLSPVLPPQQATPEPKVATDRLLAMADRLDALRKRVEANEQSHNAASKRSTQRLDAIVGTLSVIRRRLEGGQRLARGAAAATAVSPTDWLLPVVFGALGISTPPAAAIVALKLFRCWAHRRLRKRRASATTPARSLAATLPQERGTRPAARTRSPTPAARDATATTQ